MWRFVCLHFLPIRCIAMHRRWFWTLVLAAAAMSGLSGCGEQAEKPPVSADAAHHYEVRGTVVRVDAADKSAVIQHDKIADLMDAMTMSFSVPEAEDLAKLAPGKSIKATLIVENNAMWLGSVQVTGDAPVPPVEPAGEHSH